MLENIGNTGHATLNGLGELDQTSHAEKTSETKIEAAAIRGHNESALTSTKHYQLDGPKAPAIGDQFSAVAKLLDGLASTTNLLMQITENALKGKDVAKSSSEAISQSLSLIALLYEVSKLTRDQQVQQREIAVEANVASIKSQAEELNSAAKAMIAMAVVSGVLAGATAIIGAIGSFRTGRELSSEVAHNKVLKIQKAGFDQAEELMANGNMSAKQRKQVRIAYAAAKENIADTSSSLTSTGRKFEKMTGSNQARNAVLQAIGQMGNSASSVEQTKAQARSKEDEVLATRAQADKQRADEYIGFQEGLLKELRELFRSIADSQNQAWRASAPTV
ncbi:type III secretion system translocon subunit VopD [Grimontia sp. NTOU-MAR1]|uniref:type III secretion system translocon subunit VopD n=1 Tax=Grimontia sp. NTOU-MAR1 TaxID=3111011 RepID=UPI002DBFF064|nr:type III secretion system translocon subunit VopD [Grimontia sp. NTOU-MAR1]WRW00160.1 type III secretion system translocon subunit VopD [Grimontia sp. NTOU-MAR1]